MKYLFITCLSLMHIICFAQILKGTVLDHENNNPLPFANIAVEGHSQGTISNADGIYALDITGLPPSQTILFSFVGFETYKTPVADLRQKTTVSLRPATVSLSAITVHSKSQTPEDIINKVRAAYTTNHPAMSGVQTMFYHKYERTPWPDKNQIEVKSSDFPGLDASTFEELFEMLPDEFVEYQDAIVKRYVENDSSALIPVEAVSLEESAIKDLQSKMEQKMSSFLADMENTQSNPDIYYKLRSGIFAGKLDQESEEPEKLDSIREAQRKDSLHYYISTNALNGEITKLLSEYGDIQSDNWEFINKPERYSYELQDYTMYNDQLVYSIDFSPKRRGLFEGQLLIATDSYALLQVNYRYAAGKQDEKIHLLGVGHAINNVESRIMYEKYDEGYFIKYLNAGIMESASIERDFSIMKKEKRFLIDRELNEIKMSLNLFFDMNTQWELLVMDRDIIPKQASSKLEQPKYVKFRKQYAHTPDMWSKGTGLAPSQELKKYTRTDSGGQL